MLLAKIASSNSTSKPKIYHLDSRGIGCELVLVGDEVVMRGETEQDLVIGTAVEEAGKWTFVPNDVSPEFRSTVPKQINKVLSLIKATELKPAPAGSISAFVHYNDGGYVVTEQPVPNTINLPLYFFPMADMTYVKLATAATNVHAAWSNLGQATRFRAFNDLNLTAPTNYDWTFESVEFADRVRALAPDNNIAHNGYGYGYGHRSAQSLDQPAHVNPQSTRPVQAGSPNTLRVFKVNFNGVETTVSLQSRIMNHAVVSIAETHKSLGELLLTNNQGTIGGLFIPTTPEAERFPLFALSSFCGDGLVLISDTLVGPDQIVGVMHATDVNGEMRTFVVLAPVHNGGTLPLCVVAGPRLNLVGTLAYVRSGNSAQYALQANSEMLPNMADLSALMQAPVIKDGESRFASDALLRPGHNTLHVPAPVGRNDQYCGRLRNNQQPEHTAHYDYGHNAAHHSMGSVKILPMPGGVYSNVTIPLSSGNRMVSFLGGSMIDLARCAYVLTHELRVFDNNVWRVITKDDAELYMAVLNAIGAVDHSHLSLVWVPNGVITVTWEYGNRVTKIVKGDYTSTHECGLTAYLPVHTLY